MADDLMFRSVTELVASVREGDVSARELGVQLVGPPAGEELLLSLSAQLEAARPWSPRRPGVVAA